MLRFLLKFNPSVPPNLIALAWTRLGGFLLTLKSWPESLEALEQAKDLWGDLGLENSLEAAAVEFNLAKVYLQLDQLFDAKNSCIELDSFNETIETARSLNRIGMLLYQKGKFGQAEPLLKQALRIHRRLLGEEHPDVASSLNNLANLYESQGRYSEAEPLYKKALEICERVLGANHPRTQTIRQNLQLMKKT